MNDYKKNLLIFGATAVISLGLVLFLAWPAKNGIEENYKEIKLERLKMEELLAAGQNIESNAQNLQLVKESLADFREVFLNRGEELQFIQTLEAVAQHNNVQQTINLDDSALANSQTIITVVPVKLHLQGELMNLMDYINELEGLDYYINLTRLAVQSQNSLNNNSYRSAPASESASKEDRLKVEISAQTYWK